MGMDYKYAGSASYSRFGDEMDDIAVKIFNAIKTDELKERQKSVIEGTIDWWFGQQHKIPGKKYIFPEGTNETLIKWFEKPYSDFTVEETKIIADEIFKHPEIEDISHQVYYELQELLDYGESWDIN